MTALEIYKRILLRVNLNDTNGNIRVPKSTAVIIFNQEAPKWLEDRIEKSESSDDIDDVMEFLIPDAELKKLQENTDSVDFVLPKDFFYYSRSYSIASKGACKNRPLFNWNIKNKNINTILQNSNENPSFEYEETIVKIVNNKFKVYKSDFQIDKQFLDYYRIPSKIDIEGYTNYDGSPSKNVNPDFSDPLVDEVISRVALEIMRNQVNAEGFQYAKERVSTD